MTKIRRLLKNQLIRIAIGAVLYAIGIVLGALSFEALAYVLYIIALVWLGYDVVIDAVRGILRLDFLDEKFLMTVASIGACFIGEAMEGVAVMLFFKVGEYFEHKAVRHSRNSIRNLMDLRPDEAVLLKDGIEHTVFAEDLLVGDIIVLKAGDRVPCDCVTLEGTTDIDTSAMTGESLPRSVAVGDEIDGGVVVINGRILAKVIRIAEESKAQRILDLVENANENKSKEENFITKFSRIYTPIVIALALIMSTIPPIFELLTIEEAIYKALSFLVVSCPCALVISVPLAFFGGIGGAASEGVLFKGGNVFSAVARTQTVAFDKTGTLTTGKMTIKQAFPENGISEEELTSIAASIEGSSNHPIAQAFARLNLPKKTVKNIREIAGKGIVAQIDGTTYALGNEKLLADFSVGISPIKRESAIYLAKNGVYLGRITFADTVKPEAIKAIAALRRVGIKNTVMLSGDKHENAEAVGNTLGIDKIYGNLLPEEKYQMLESIIDKANGSVMYVGDGINDTPSLARADVGVAMGGIGQDSAIEVADVVIMSDNLFKLSSVVKIARKTLAIAKQNIAFAIGIKLLVMLLVTLGLAGMWLAVFADVGVSVIAILNSMRTLRQR